MSGPVADEERVSILLVDDRPGNIVSLQGVLDRPEYELVIASSGEEALALVLRHDFAVILLDVAMPGMDGFEVASTLKKRERYRSIPIIFVTASVQHIEWIFNAYSVGAVDFLQKPLDPHAVRTKVAVFVELYRQKVQIKRQAEQLYQSERRERALELERVKLESEQRYRSLAEAIPHVVWTAGAGGEVEYFNQQWFGITGLEEEASLGNGWRRAVHAEDAEAVARAWVGGMRSTRAFELEFRLRGPTGIFRWYHGRALPERDVDGRVVGWLGTFTDVDEQKRAHQESMAAIRLRDEFLSVASHELRTPLSALQLNLQAVQPVLERKEGLEAPMARRLGAAIRQTSRLATLVERLLDVSRITTGYLELHPEELDLAQLAREVTERFGEELERAGCELRLELEPLPGRWDRLRLEQALTNLLVNAIKYAPGKPVRVRVAQRAGRAQLQVEDQGMGIPAEQLDRVFDRFERAVPTRHYGGLGLGLYIVRQIVDAHGGRVEVQSRPGRGAQFTIDLPLRVAEAKEEVAPAASGPH